ncbi:MAG: hypothetical protein WD097_03900, partial [Balneolales bacterium]
MARVILGLHGLGNKADRKTLEAWWRMSLEEGLEKQGITAGIPRFEMVYWADIMHPEPLDVTVEDPDSAYYDDEQYTRAVPGYKRK